MGAVSKSLPQLPQVLARKTGTIPVVTKEWHGILQLINNRNEDIILKGSAWDSVDHLRKINVICCNIKTFCLGDWLPQGRAHLVPHRRQSAVCCRHACHYPMACPELW